MRILFLMAALVILGSRSPTAVDLLPNREGVQEPECMQCHQGLLDQEVVHPVAEDGCDNCHISNGNPHPDQDSTGFTLMDRLPDLCFYCHEEPAEQTHEHLPVKEKNCLACHDVHGSPEYGLLKVPEQELCLSCHDGTGADGGANIKMLITGNRVVHSAISGGGCITCHLPHGSELRALLVATYPKETYPEARQENFELCFLCHDSDLLVAEATDGATSFRNGTQNLHRLHIHGTKGRNCRLCHNLHGSGQKYLIEERVPYGEWVMLMNFEPVEKGGSCLPGCHAKKTYER
jgi:predicted CXXCH cytochrome family protein